VNTSVAATAPSANFLALLEAGRLVVAPGVFDGLSARVVEQAGFEAVYVSGGAIARSSGVPDLGLLTMHEMLARIREVVDAVRVPVIADADTGYGNPLNVIRTVHEYERAGVAALHIEDQETPKRCGHYDEGAALIRPEAMVQKLRAALDARGAGGPAIIARTDARAGLGLDEAIRRARLYAAAGADMIFVEAPRSRAEIAAIAAAIRAPLLLNMFAGGKTPLLSAAEVERYGYRVMIVPSDLQRAALRAMQEVARALRRDGSSAAVLDRLAGFDERDAVVDLPRHQALAAEYAD
jgi:2-methylisocitrate lyase-like PEP mutase family enzyme